MSDYDIHSCGYYCDRPVCIVAQRNELRDKLFSEQAVKTYSGGSGSTHFIHMHNGWRFLKKDEPVIDKSMCEPKREWVGLTEQEQSDIAWEKDKSRIWIVTATEAKLKEKNGG